MSTIFFVGLAALALLGLLLYLLSIARRWSGGSPKPDIPHMKYPAFVSGMVARRAQVPALQLHLCSAFATTLTPCSCSWLRFAIDWSAVSCPYDRTAGWCNRACARCPQFLLDVLKQHGRVWQVEGVLVFSDPALVEKVMMVKANTTLRHPIYNAVGACGRRVGPAWG
jgi:hypothetical protein